MRHTNRNYTQPALLGLLGLVGTAVATRYIMHRMRHFDPAGRVALVTGGTRGLGLNLARELARHGAQVAICARDQDELDRAQIDLQRISPKVFACQCDLTNEDDIQEMVEAVERHFGQGIDILINNAGVIQVGPLENLEREDYETAMAMHFWAPFHTTRAVVPGMRGRGGGRIVNIASIGGKFPFPHMLSYVTSKHALVGFSQGLRAELCKDNILVTTVSPGLMRAGSYRQAQVRGQYAKELAWFAIGDSLPGLSMSVESAARKIIRAMMNGQADLTLTLPAKVQARLHSLFPGLSLAVNALANYLLPAPAPHATPMRKGKDIDSPWAPSALTALNDRSARRNNQMHNGHHN